MGICRLLLSLLVVGSHFGNLDEPAGGTAVASFFAISGFLMARTIRENYSGLAGSLRFYLNRLVRLAPPLLVVLFLTALVLWARDSRPFQTTLEGGFMMPDANFPPSWWKLIQLRSDSYPTYLFAQVYLAPQAWSLPVEGVFYLLAPLLLFVAARRTSAPLLWLAAGVSLTLAVLAALAPEVGNRWLRSPISSLWIFAFGMQAYLSAPAIAPRFRWVARGGAGLALAILAAVGLSVTPLPDRAALFVAPVLVVIWLLLTEWAVRRSGRIDRMLGNFAYGVFVGHFLTSLVKLWTSEALYHATGMLGVLGVPGQTERLWRWTFYAFAVAGGAAIYYGVERPFERLRARLRRADAPEARPPAPA